MNDRQLVTTAVKHAELKAEIRKLEVEAEQLRDKVLVELDRRNATAVVAHGTKVTKALGRRTYNVDVAREHLLAPVFRRIVKHAIDADAVKREVEAGRLTDADVDRIGPRGQSYITVKAVA